VKRLGFLLLLLVAFQSCAQQSKQDLDLIHWNSPYFVVNYSEWLEQPVDVRYRVACTDGTASRKGLNFHTESNVHTSDDADYYKNEWDKGHMAPAGSLNCTEDMLWETFSYVNCALQHEKLNRGVWKTLEERERYLSEWVGMNADVYIELDFGDYIERVPAGAAIPIGFYKEVIIGDLRECYWFANVEPLSDDLEDYQCKCRE